MNKTRWFKNKPFVRSLIFAVTLALAIVGFAILIAGVFSALDNGTWYTMPPNRNESTAHYRGRCFWDNGGQTVEWHDGICYVWYPD